jgi:hypothetical protein
VNAAAYFAALMPAEAVRRIAVLPVGRFESSVGVPDEVLDVEDAREHVSARWGGNLCGLLNAMTRGELAALARALLLPDAGRSFELRESLWRRGAELERGGAPAEPAVQPVPVVLGGHLVVMAPPRGAFPPSRAWPRPVPLPVFAAPPPEEPETVDDLLAAADRAIGVRLGARGRDKGAWGSRAASLLGVIDRGLDEPDWRGDVEIKTVPIAREASGRWRFVEDPAIAMVGELATTKLVRTLWLARADVDGDDATIVSWYLLDWDAEIARLARRYLHIRPKGPAGGDGRGFYLHKRFFADAGMLATLNGSP